MTSTTQTRRDVRLRRAITPWLYLLPWLVGAVLFTVGPALLGLVMSFSNWNLLFPVSWVGLDNYEEMITDDYRFWMSLRITGFYLILSVPVYLVVGLSAALLLNQRVWGIRMFRTILFLPSVLSGVAVAVLWMLLLSGENGAVNTVLRNLGVENPPQWFTDPSWAVPAIVIVGLWGVLGSGAIIYLAGLQNISPAMYEAAMIDGAGAWRRFRSITIPLLTPTLFFMLLISIIGAFQVFDTAFTISGGRGGDGLRFYLIYLWEAGFRDGRLGYAAALSMVLFLIGTVIVLILLKTQDRWVHYEDEGA
ncbi:carbohydrate ABC transporter permease [Microbacterium insulae]|uniref:Carbohydrate ABC transporter permease n=1 Tax=Microbacterium insulae TaxID=483014 RepID=A0ABW3AIJ3_9MICO